jgi:biopolymer transport protein TolR
MNTRRLRRKPMSEINVVPYIDVMLVLLVIFMITAPLQQNGIEVDLPITQGHPIQSSEQRTAIIISIKTEGRYYLSENGAKAIAFSKEDLILKVATLFQQHPKLYLYIRGDKNVNYGYVVSLMAALKQSGLTQIGLMTTPKN